MEGIYQNFFWGIWMLGEGVVMGEGYLWAYIVSVVSHRLRGLTPFPWSHIVSVVSHRLRGLTSFTWSHTVSVGSHPRLLGKSAPDGALTRDFQMMHGEPVRAIL